MEITFLGTSAVVPGAGHDTASIVLNGQYLIDTGWYAAIKMKSYGFNPVELDTLFLTHCHHDHYIGLPHLLFYLCMRRNEKANRKRLKIVGPAADLSRIVSLARALLQPDRFPDVNYIPDLFPLEPGGSFEDEVFRVETCASKHPVPALCYRFTEKRTGATFATTGDTAPHPPIVEHVRGVDLLVHEASFGAKPADGENKSLHSGAPDAAKVALEAGVKRLAIVHCPEDQQEAALAAAKKIFPQTFWPVDGQKIDLPFQP